MMNKEVIDFYQLAYNRLGKQTKQVLEDPRFMELVRHTREKWHLGADWQRLVLEDYIERIDTDLRIKANEENCFEIEEKLKLSPELRFYHGLDRALVDLYIRLELFKENESAKSATAIDPRRNWATFTGNLKEICMSFDLVPADSLFVYRVLLALPPIDIVKVATTPHIEFTYDKATGINVVRIEMTDDALRYFSEYSLAMIKDAIEEIKHKKQEALSHPTSGNLDATWYYKSYSEALREGMTEETNTGFLTYLMEEAAKVFQVK